MSQRDLFDTPPWARGLLSDARHDDASLLRLSIRVASASVENGSGPFGAVVATRDGEVVDLGWNAVLWAHDSTAHAEIVALRRAQRRLGTHDLASRDLTLATSCAPCIQCFGAIWWSGVRRVLSGATTADAEALGFLEGPVSEALWQRAREAKGVEHRGGIFREEAQAPLRAYLARGGPLY